MIRAEVPQTIFGCWTILGTYLQKLVSHSPLKEPRMVKHPNIDGMLLESCLEYISETAFNNSLKFELYRFTVISTLLGSPGKGLLRFGLKSKIWRLWDPITTIQI